MNEAQKTLNEEKKLQKVGEVSDFARQEVSLLQDAMQKAADAKAKLGALGAVDASHYTSPAGDYTKDNLELIKELNATCQAIHLEAQKKDPPVKKNETFPPKSPNTQILSNTTVGNNAFRVGENLLQEDLNAQFI